LAQICTKSFVGWGFVPDPTGGAYSAPPDPLAGLRGPTSKGRGREREGRGKGREWGGEGEGEERGMGTTSFWTLPPPLNILFALQLHIRHQRWTCGDVNRRVATWAM